MCGIFLSEASLDPKTCGFIIRRGKDYNKTIKFGKFNLLSSVLNIRSCVQQPILERNFSLQFNGEIYNDTLSDTLFINDALFKYIKSDHISLNFDICLNIINSVYSDISAYENEMAICITFGDFICFYKDDVGRRSLGYNLEPFSITSVLYSYEIDPLKIYIYDAKTGILHSRFKPFSDLVVKYLTLYPCIEKYFTLEKYKNEFNYIKDYDTIKLPTIKNETKVVFFNDHLANLHKLILNSFKKRKYHDNPVVFLSGGIDSLIVAIYTHLTIECERTIFLINTAVPGSFDREVGILAYLDLKRIFPNRKFIFIENNLSLDLILEHKNTILSLVSPKKTKMDFNIASVLYFSAMEACKHSKVVFLGSGADEVFGGYKKYNMQNNRGDIKNNTDELKDHHFRKHMLFDLFTISSHNLCRDDRVISNWNLETRFPVLDTEIIKFSLDAPDEIFIKNGQNKFILRELLKFHNFERASDVPKKAMQYGTGMSTFENEIYK